MQITHCPQCATAFKVSPEQLRQAQGWVRCGRCSAVFEARSGWTRGWIAGAVLAALCLLWQGVLWQRHWLGAEEPALRGTLAALCMPVGCDVHWPKEPDALLIESSNFSRHGESGYAVQLHLKNTQYHSVASPALELTLTDLNDDVVLRRVFSTQELALPDHLAALHDADTTLNFDLDDSVSRRVTGFRALIFYP